jgi:hypothetical protein
LYDSGRSSLPRFLVFSLLFFWLPFYTGFGGRRGAMVFEVWGKWFFFGLLLWGCGFGAESHRH